MKSIRLFFFLLSLGTSFLHAAAFAKKSPKRSRAEPMHYVTVVCDQLHRSSFYLTKKQFLGAFIYTSDRAISSDQLQHPLEYLLHEINEDTCKFKGSSVTGGDLFVQSDHPVQVAFGIKMTKRDLLLTFWVMHLHADSGSFSCSSKGRISYALTGKNLGRSSRIALPARSKLDVYRISVTDTSVISCSLNHPLESAKLMNLHASQDHVDQFKDLQSPFVLIHLAKLLARLK